MPSQIRVVLDASPDLIARYDRGLRCVYVNEAIARTTGEHADRMLGRRIKDVVPDADVGRRLERAVQQVLDTGCGQTLEYEAATVAGRSWYQARLVPEVDGAGEVSHVLLWARDLTARRRAEDGPRASEADLLAAQALAKVGNWSVDLRTGASTWSDELYRLLGYDIGQVQPSKAAIAARLHPDDADRVGGEVATALAGGQPFALDYRVILPDGDERWMHSQSNLEVDAHGQPSRLHGAIQDITERKRAGQALERSEDLLAGVLGSSLDGVVALRAVRDENQTIVDFEFLLVNGAMERIIGRSAASLLGRRVLAELPGLGADGLFDHYVDVVALREPLQSEQRYAHDGLDLWIYLSAVPLGDGVVITVADVSDHKRAEARQSHDQLHDRVTGLPNLALLLDRLHHALDRRQRTNDWVTLFSVDVDQLKAVNDTLGHDVGDEALRAVGSRLRHHARPSDTVGRLGGDRFVVVCEGLDEHAADALARRLLGAFAAPLDIGEQEVTLSVSIGVVVTSEGDPGADQLLAAADDALLQAKAFGYGRHQFFDERLQASARARAELGEELRLALDLGQFTVLYQPVVRLDDLRVTGFEALVRWQHPRRGLMAPADFIPLAEETGFIVPLGTWVLEEACRQRAHWAEVLGPRGEVTIAVNLSACQLVEDNVITLVKSALARTGIPPQSLCLEVTETGLLDVSTAPDTLEALAATGVRIALDDFGTGYSSVGHLRRFPVHTIKIDRAFVADLDGPDGGPPVVAALAALASTLGLEVVAEGVETRDQLLAVRTLGIQSAQGYLFAAPLTQEAATDLLERGSWADPDLESLLMADADTGEADGVAGRLAKTASLVATGTMNSQLAERFAVQRLIVDNYPAGALTVFDTDLRYVIVGGIGLATASPKELEGRLVAEALPPVLVALLEPHYRAALLGESTTLDVPNGGRTMELRIGPIRDAATERVIAGLICTRDVTEERQSAGALAEAQERFRTAFEHAPIGMAVVGMDGRYQQVNQALCELTGYTTDELCKLTYKDITHRDDQEVNLAYVRGLAGGAVRSNQIEKRFLHARGHVVWVLLTATLMRSPDGEPLYYISQIQDISERKDQEEILRWQAERDGLTRLWNRHSFEQELNRCQDLAERHGKPSSVILFDLDRFKIINDTLGHGAGDEVLRRVASVLMAGVRASDMAARYGGDEFAVVLPGTTREVAEQLADRLLQSIAAERIVIDGQIISVSASAGVADNASGSDLIAAADRALYDVKRARATI